MVVVSLILGGFVAATVWAMRFDTESSVVLIKKMKDSYDRAQQLVLEQKKEPAKKELAETKKYADRVLARDPMSPIGNLLAGQCLRLEGHPAEALAYYRRVDDNTREAALCYISAAQIMCDESSQYKQAEALLRRAIRIDPNETASYGTLAFILKLATRTWERIPIVLHVFEGHKPDIRLVEELSRNERLPPELGVLLRGIKLNPDDPNVLLGHANLLRVQQHYGEAEALLRKAIESDPEIDEAHVRLGLVLFESGDDAKFVAWHAAAKESLVQHPLFWAVCGARARRAGEKQVAARCFWEAVKRDPNLLSANYQLAQLLIEMGRRNEAQPFLERTAKLITYIQLARQNAVRAAELGGKGDPDLAAQGLKACDELGNIWEMYAWVEMNIELDPSNKALMQTHEQLAPILEKMEKRRTMAAANPTNKVDLSKLPLPQWTAASALRSPEVPAPSRVSFEDRAASAGIAFQYFDGSDPQVHALNKMHEVNGGGVGVVDFDRDGWPDLYFTQGSADPQDHEQTEHLDRLYRNLGDGHFVDVTSLAGIVENGYSQGVTVGDVDNDGFPDIYVGNIGSNRLFLNNGDGTFSDATEQSGTGESLWTSSCVLADFNGDSLPDLYTVGFMGGDALTRICNNQQKRLDSCVPFQFPASKHRLWLNQGDGRFKDVSVASGIDQTAGRGTAVIAADFDGSRRLNLLVGNNDSPNFYFKNQDMLPDQGPKFVEAALAAGLGVGDDGSPRNCRGIAAGDFNGDGRLDFHGTSTFEESDTLFLQEAGGLFVDASRNAGIHDPTFIDVGFGTQAIDGDLDGNLDLFTANGNSDNLKSEYVQYEMPPTYFANNGKGRFVRVPAETLGPYFKGQYLGRAVTRVDWNRDGREDLVVSNSRSPAALLTNATPNAGHHLTIRLVSTGSARDSIGTTVELTAGGRKIVRQLTAGDGFHASNERSLVFGLGPSTSADSVTIHWMSGRDQKLAAAPADQEILVVEGRAEPIALRH